MVELRLAWISSCAAMSCNCAPLRTVIRQVADDRLISRAVFVQQLREMLAGNVVSSAIDFSFELKPQMALFKRLRPVRV